MNKYQEALSSVLFTMHNRVKPKALGRCEDSNFDLLQELVDRETPVAIELRNDGFHCPRCGASIHNKLIYTFYCNECGQAFEGGMKDVK